MLVVCIVSGLKVFFQEFHVFSISFRCCSRVCTMPCRLFSSLECKVLSSVNLSSFSEFSFFKSNIVEELVLDEDPIGIL